MRPNLDRKVRPQRHRGWLLLPAIGLALAVALRLPAAGATARVEFDVAAGSADQTLRAFAAQSGHQLIYPNELVEHVSTPRLKGRFTPKEALDRLLADTGLSVWEDEQTGALAIGRGWQTSKAQTIQLPPFVVEEKADAPRWQYVEAPGIEVLSRCTDQVTTQLIKQHYVLNQLLAKIVPREFQFRSDQPTVYLFFNNDGKSVVSKELLGFLKQREAEIIAAKIAAGGKADSETLVGALPNFRFWDQDMFSAFFVWDENVGTPALMPASSYVRYLLEGRTPALPRWFIDGTMELYRAVDMKTQALDGGGYPKEERELGLTVPFIRLPVYAVSFRRLVWVSPAVTEKLLEAMARSQNSYYQQLMTLDVAPLPLAEAFSEGPAGSEQRERVRACTRGLFLRSQLGWNQAALWKFVDRSSREPITEALFKECFGEGYEDADDALGKALVASLTGKSKLVLPALKDPEIPAITIRTATEAEVSRLKGAFNRLEISYVRELYPEITGKYVEQARATLRLAYDGGNRDPRLIAELGLCECDAGNDARARPFLEAAVKAGVVRPRAHYELARIRFAALRAAEPAGRLTAGQLTSVLDPLLTIRGQSPALGEGYELMAEAWLRSAVQPDAGQLAILDEGTGLFPRRTRLLLSVALLNAGQGRVQTAQALIKRGLQLATAAAEKDRFLKLQEALGAGPAAGRQ